MKKDLRNKMVEATPEVTMISSRLGLSLSYFSIAILRYVGSQVFSPLLEAKAPDARTVYAKPS